MKKRFLLPLLLFFLPATIISAAYAGFVYSNKVDTKTDSNSGKIDDVKPNFKLDENNYTIYFFPSMQAAKLDYTQYKNGQGLIDEQSIVDAFNASSEKPKDNDEKKIYAWGSWADSSHSEIISNSNLNGYNDSYRKYYPKKIQTHGGPSITLEEFQSISEPITNGFDKYRNFWGDPFYHVVFSGWTAVKSSSISAYASQGEYNYISAFDDLTKIDNEANDGSDKNDKIIFVYPIFTSGKDYDNKKNSVQLLENSNPDATKTRYFSRVDGDENKTYFYYKNLVVNSTDRWNLQFAGLKENSLSWYEDWYNYSNKIGDDLVDIYFYNNSLKENVIIEEPGIYNVYVYLQRQYYLASSFNSSNAHLFNSTINSNNTPLVYDDNVTNSTSDIYKRSVRRHYFWMFVRVEKVYEFRLAGTEGRGFTFDTAGQLYVSRFSSSKDASLGGLWKMYYLDNVFMEKGKNHLFTEYTNSDGKKYKIRNTVFSFLPSDENLSTIGGIEAMKEEELHYVNTNEPDLNVKGNYKGISETSFKKINNNPSEYIKNPEYLPNYNPESAYADYFFSSEFKYSGFCKVLIKVDFATSGEHKGKPSSIRIAMAPYLTNVHKVYVYPNETDLVSFIDPDTKLIDPENNTTLKAIELTSFEMKANDDYVLNDQEITLKDGSKMMLSAYLTQYDVVDHLTNKKIEIGKSYKRHMACWQRVKTS